jgi:hypothetical protein
MKLILLAFISMQAWAACHVVTAAGSGSHTGADWNNAYTQLPSTLTRGDTYYLADGAYNSYNFTTANSSTTTITIKKATATDHCTDTGWNTSTMGSGQASFGPGSSGNGACFPWFNRDSGVGYYTLDGQVGAGEGTTAYGIKLDTSTCSTVTFTRGIELTNSSNVTVRYVEIQGLCNGIAAGSYRSGCDAITDGTAVESAAYIFGSSNITLEHLWFHDTANGGIDVGTTSDLIWQNSIITRMTYTQAQHTNCLSAHGGTDGIIVRYNVFHDAEGTGCITSLNSGSPVTDANWEIYGNVFWGTSGNPYGRIFFQNGAVACINGNECPGWKIYNNSFINLSDGNQNGVCWFNSATAATKPVIVNNIWYNSENVTFTGIPSGYTEDYNSFLNSGTNGTGAADVENAAASDPFTAWASANFHLSADSADVNNWTALSSPYNVDPDSVTRTSSRGAYQYVALTAPARFRGGQLKGRATVK